MRFKLVQLRALMMVAIGGALLGACGTTGGAPQSGTSASSAKASRSNTPQIAARNTKTLLALASRARQCGSPVIASMGSSVAVVYYLSQVKGGTFRRDDRLMDGLARRAYAGRYPTQNITCVAAFRKIRELYNLVERRAPRARNAIYRYAIALLRSDGQYARVMAQYRARNRQVQNPQTVSPRRRYQRWERVYKLPENAVDL